MVLVRDSMLAVALLAVTFWHNWQLMLMTVFLVAASPFVLCSISLRRRLIVKASQDNVVCDALTGGRVIRRTKARTGRLQLRQ